MLSIRIVPIVNCAILLLSIIQMAHCRYMIHTEIQRETSQHKVIATWEQAEQRCVQEGAILASPLNAELLKYMKSVIAVNNHTTPYFIGTKAKRDVDLEFLTEEGVQLEDVPEAVDMVEQLDPHAGDCLCMDAHSIRAVPCWTRLPYMCYKNVTSTTSATTEPLLSTTAVTGSSEGVDYWVTSEKTRLECEPDDYELHGTGCYKRHDITETWDDANKTCEAEGAYLIIVNDNAEAEIVKSFDTDPTHYWVGVRREPGDKAILSIHGDRLEDIYHVMDDFYFGDSECYNIDNLGLLNDAECYQHIYFICEK